MAGQTVRGALEELGAWGVMAALGLDPLPGHLARGPTTPISQKKLYLGGKTGFRSTVSNMGTGALPGLSVGTGAHLGLNSGTVALLGLNSGTFINGLLEQ